MVLGSPTADLGSPRGVGGQSGGIIIVTRWGLMPPLPAWLQGCLGLQGCVQPGEVTVPFPSSVSAVLITACAPALPFISGPRRWPSVAHNTSLGWHHSHHPSVLFPEAKGAVGATQGPLHRVGMDSASLWPVWGRPLQSVAPRCHSAKGWGQWDGAGSAARIPCLSFPPAAQNPLPRPLPPPPFGFWDE